MDKLNFGTDGWRDIIAEKYTFLNVKRASQAYADYLLTQKASTVLVGHDTRFNGERFARCAAEVLAANDLRVLLAKSYIPTPALSFAVKHYGAGGGIMLTASHNPPAYHGFKLKGPYGGTATPDIYKAVSERVAAIAAADIRPFDAKRHAIETFDIQAAYYDAVQKLLDLEALKAIDFPVWHEAMGGAGTGWLSGFFNYAGLRQSITEIHSKADPLFYGVNPEPLPINLGESMALVKNEARGLVICSDGDADRIAAVLPAGRFFNPHQIFAVLLHHLHHKGLSGKVVKTFTASRVIERLAKARGLEVIETPVGFKYIVDAMLAGGILIGGEESGGIGVAGHIPERDSLANGLLLLELMVKSGKNPAELFSEIEEEVAWQHSYDRLDLHLSGNALKDAVLTALNDPPKRIAGRAVESVERLDGVKLNLSGNAWLMFRASGTEPLLRIYCEAATEQDVKRILDGANEFVRGLE